MTKLTKVTKLTKLTKLTKVTKVTNRFISENWVKFDKHIAEKNQEFAKCL